MAILLRLGEVDTTERQRRWSLFQKLTLPVCTPYEALGASNSLPQATPPLPNSPPVQVDMSRNSHPGKQLSSRVPSVLYVRLIRHTIWSVRTSKRHVSETLMPPPPNSMPSTTMVLEVTVTSGSIISPRVVN